MRVLVASILAWLAECGPPYVHVSTTLAEDGATEDDLNALEQRIGRPLPLTLRALLRTIDGGLHVGEYITLSAAGIARVWSMCKRLLDDGTFASVLPAVDSDGLLKPGWWHPGLVPILEDSGGNLICVDLDPGPRGLKGQMVWWEVHEGPMAHGADSLLTFLRTHWRHLSSGVYDAPGAWEASDCWTLTQVEGKPK
jgi:cell wall assembly regulator SMI1